MAKKVSNHTALHYILTALGYIAKSLLQVVLWILIITGGYFILESKMSPYNMIIGIPLMLIGLGFLANDLMSDLLAIFSPKFNRGVCRYCS